MRLFETMNEYEIYKVLDAIKPIIFKAGDIIINEVYLLKLEGRGREDILLT